VADVNVPDGTQFLPGAKFTKTWIMESSGCAPWPEGCTWAFVSGEQMGAPSGIPVPDTALGGTVELSVEMVAPAAPGTYKGYWQMQMPNGTPFGEQAYVMIVVPAPTPTPAATPTPAVCPPNPAPVEVINQLNVQLTIQIMGPRSSTIVVPANSTQRYCAPAGDYTFTARASGFNALEGSKTFASGRCQCWWFYAGIRVQPLCNCDADLSHYYPLP
jgi:hypothetical protein